MKHQPRLGRRHVVGRSEMRHPTPFTSWTDRDRTDSTGSGSHMTQRSPVIVPGEVCSSPRLRIKAIIQRRVEGFLELQQVSPLETSLEGFEGPGTPSTGPFLRDSSRTFSRTSAFGRCQEPSGPVVPDLRSLSLQQKTGVDWTWWSPGDCGSGRLWFLLGCERRVEWAVRVRVMDLGF